MTQFAFPMTGLDSGWPDGSDGWGNSFRSNMAIVQALTRRRVINQTTNTPPGSPAAGDCYIIGPSPTGAWSGKSKQIAIYGELWYYITPELGLSDFYDVAVGRWYRYDGSAWADVFVAETQLSIKGAVALSMPNSGTYNLSRAESASTAIFLVGTPSTPPVTLQWLSVNDDVIPSEVAVWAGYCGAPTLLKSQTVPANTFVLLGGGLARIVASPVGNLWGNFLYAYNQEALATGPYHLSYSSGGLYTLDGVQDRGKVLDITSGYTTVKPPNTTNFGDADCCTFYVRCRSADGATIVPDTGSTLYGPTELTEGDFAIIQRHDITDDYHVRIIPTGPSSHKGITAQSGTTYTLDRFDRGTIVKFSNAADVAVTVPDSSTNDMGDDCICYVISTGAGGLHFVPDTGVTLEGPLDLTKGEEAILRREGVTDTWRITILTNKGRHAGIYDDSTTAYTLARKNKGQLVNCTNAAAVALTIPDSSNVEMGEDCECWVRAEGAAGVTLTPDTGVTIKGPTALATDDVAHLRRVGVTDTWISSI